MGDPFSGAAIGVLFAEVFILVKDAVNTTIQFRSRLESLQTTFGYVQPIINQIDSYNDQLDHPKEEMKRLHELMTYGKVIIIKSSKVTTVNFYKRYKYSKKLADLDNQIVKFFQIYIVVNSRDTKETLVDVKEMKHMLAAIHKLSLMPDDGPSNKGMKPPISESCAVPKAPEFVVGLDGSVQQLKSRLLTGGASVIVVSAPGGCGKTTLVKTLSHNQDIKGKFKNNIFFVTFSETPNFTAIVKNMLNHKGKNVPLIETEEQGVNELRQLLLEIGRDPVLLVIDDVWSESDSLLSNFWLDEIQDYKILVTSRSDLSRFGTPHKLNPLKHEHARELFLHSATPNVGRAPGPIGSSFRSSSMRPNDELIDMVVRRCKGSPLALTVVGKSLCGKHPDVWKSRLLEWSENLFLDSNKAILDCLRRSVDDLDERHKEAFLDLGSFPEDHAIPATALIDMWIELHGLDADGVQAKGILQELAARNLVDLFATKNDESEGDGNYNDLYVRQHDLLRELAILMNSQGLLRDRKRLHLDIVGNKIGVLDEKTLNTHLMSISTDENFSSNWFHLELPTTEVLVLNFRTKNYTLPTFIEKIVSLKTLIITNNGFFPAELSNFSVLESLPNLKRIRFDRIKMPSCVRFNVKRASFFMCEMMDTIAMPNLEEIDISYCSDLESLPTGLCDSRSLRKVSITSCHSLELLPDEIENLSELQVLRLSSCLNLSGLPKSIGRIQKMAFLDISDCFSINELPDEIGGLRSLKELHMKGCLGLSMVPEYVVNLQQLKYVICDEQRAYLWRYYKQRLPKMELRIIREEINLNWLLK